VIYSLKPYLDYKDSGSRWLGPVPAHWEVLPLGRLMAQRVEKNDPIKTHDILSLSMHTGVIPYSEKKTGGNKAKDDLSAYTLAYPGDIVLNSMNVVVGSVGLSKYFGAVSPVYYVLYPRHTNGAIEFFDAVFQDSTFQGSLFGLGNGIMVIQSRSTGKLNTIRMRIPMSALRRVLLPHPSHDEQSDIVRFLDYTNGRLDRAIRAKRKVIALLHEQKQAIIHRAVTRGIDYTVPLKPSGIPWLGEIPKHWEVRRLKHCVTPIEQGWSPQCDAQPAGDNEWGVLKVGCVNKDSFRAAQNKKLPESLAPELYLEIQDGDILMSRANTRELLGLAALAEKPRPKLLLCDKLFRFRARQECFNPKFLILALRAQPSRMQIESSTNGASSSMQNIGQSVVKNLWLSMPSVSEQGKIVVQLTADTQPLATAITRLEREIELLREYRTRLVADVVTGKLDVRPAARQLPDKPVEPEAAPDPEELTEPEDAQT